MQQRSPTAEEQLEFLTKVERLLAKGRRTTTYKFALLIALTNLAVEIGSDSNDVLVVSVDDIARQFLSLYWKMARPYPRLAEVLKQSTNASKPAKMITLLIDEARHSESSYQRLRVYQAQRDELLAEAKLLLKRDVLYRLQVVENCPQPDAEVDRFLYDSPRSLKESRAINHLTLKPGVAACLRRLRGVIISIAEARWAQWVREHNTNLGADYKLENFLFVPVRGRVTEYAERFYELQSGRCFYSGDKLAKPSAGEVDHFIPWSRYPFDSPFNLVLASRRENSKWRDQLKPAEYRDLWLQRNIDASSDLIAPRPAGFGALKEDAETVKSISRWLYASRTA